jgi:hypothetical protein
MGQPVDDTVADSTADLLKIGLAGSRTRNAGG